jgi:hypothetical protein
MADTYLTLGGYTFDGFGIPEKINGGGEQHLKVHKLLGGQRVIDALGGDDDTLKFRGRFRGAGAMDDALLMDAMRIAGAPVTLSYWNLQYTVVVSKFCWDFEKFYEVPYELECVVVANQLQQPAQPDQTVDGAVSSDITAGAGAAAGDPACAAAFAALPTTYAATGPLQSISGAVSDAASAVSSGVSSAIGQIQAAQQQVQGALSSIAATANAALAPINDLVSQVNGVVGQVTGPVIGANLTALAGTMSAGATAQVTLPFVGRIGLNLSASVTQGVVVS